MFDKKYVILDNVFPIISIQGIDHSGMAGLTGMEPTSAGFFNFNNGIITVYGGSNSLGLKSKETDVRIILTKLYQ